MLAGSALRVHIYRLSRAMLILPCVNPGEYGCADEPHGDSAIMACREELVLLAFRLADDKQQQQLSSWAEVCISVRAGRSAMLARIQVARERT